MVHHVEALLKGRPSVIGMKTLAELLGVTAPTARGLVERGEIGGGFRIGKRRSAPWRVPLAAVEQYLHDQSA
ncbi:MAG: helix-turn-helix transcriptional regulator [Planctomycetota bacterium]